MHQSKAKITAIGSYVPEHIMTNQYLEKLVDTNDEWIISRTGIVERRIASEHEFTSDIGYNAVLDLMQRYNKAVDDVDMIITCTFTPDFKTPSSANLIQAKLGIKQSGAIDLNAACAGFTYGLHMANALISSGLHKKVLVIGAETLSKVTDYTDRSTCILFGDGGGAMLVEYDEQHPSFISYHLDSEGEKSHNLYCSGLSSSMNEEQLLATEKIVQNGREVYKWAVSSVPKGLNTLLQNANMTLDQIDWFVPHSANLRMIESICERTKFPIDHTLYSLVNYGNTSSATIPLAIDLAVKEDRIKKDDHLVLYGFGGGLTQAGIIIKWAI
ncbi:ketoacyl-ACP synthase III [Paenibacillus endoradicis]|uniref:ketoacyl-ACP synthase III n=1 Tax=Paenibacillus endoradicis TaxID=2972487 RepID=UPI0021590C9E|nr:ketoacyl-ACP synthase III [Paenibacillus endoradicis]MCR8659997.1 ketoacyl-ACP synthase III [Paenibacillus endoradicis]